MKKFCFLSAALLLLLYSGSVTAQTIQTQPNALESMHQFIGSWQANSGIDTIEVWDCGKYGNALIINVSKIVKGQKTPLFVNNVGFDKRDGKVKGYALWPNGDYLTWTLVFDPANKFLGELMDTYDPAKNWGKFEMTILSTEEWNWKHFDMGGKLIDEMNFVKVK
jgi:hypothetical protein